MSLIIGFGGGLPQIPQQSHRRVVTCRSDHRSCWVAACAGGIKSINGGFIWNPVGKPERIIDMMYMPAGNSKMLFDFWRRQRKGVYDQVRRSRSKAIADRKQMFHVFALFRFPCRPLQFIRHPLNKQRRIMIFLSILQRRIYCRVK